MNDVRIWPDADRDLDRHSGWRDFQRGDGVPFLLAFWSMVQRLVEQPTLGSRVSLWREREGSRAAKIDGYSEYLIVYRAATEGVEILRVVHATANWRAAGGRSDG